MVRPSDFQCMDCFVELVDHQRRQSQGWLIQHEQPWTGHQSTADGQHLLLPAGQGAGQLLAPFCQDGKKPIGSLECLEAFPACPGGTHLEVFLHRHVGKNVATLGHQRQTQTHPAVWRLAMDGTLLKRDVTRLAAHQPQDSLQDGGFPSPIRANHGDQFSGPDVQGDVPQRRDVAVCDVKPPHL